MIKPAKARHRIMAFLFDLFVIVIVGAIFMTRPVIDMIQTIKDSESLDIIALVLNTFISGGVTFIFIFFYNIVIPLIFKGQTIGKKFFRIKVVKLDGSEVDALTIIIRELIGKLLLDFSSFGLSVLASCYTVINNNNRLTYHDVLASTIVVDVE